MNDVQAQAGTPDPIADTVRTLLQGAAVRVGPDVDRGQLHALIERLVDELRGANRVIDIERAAAERCAGERDEATALLRQASHDIQQHIADAQKAAAQFERLKRPLLSFISTIENTGGVNENLEPVADEDWQDLGEAYAEACSALDVPMKQVEPERCECGRAMSDCDNDDDQHKDKA